MRSMIVSVILGHEEATCPSFRCEKILDRAFRDRYGVAAINVVNDLTLEAVLAAAIECAAPSSSRRP